MRAAIGIYEHPDWSSEESKSEARTMLCAAVGVLTIVVASTLAAYRYRSMGKSVQDSFDPLHVSSNDSAYRYSPWMHPVEL